MLRRVRNCLIYYYTTTTARRRHVEWRRRWRGTVESSATDGQRDVLHAAVDVWRLGLSSNAVEHWSNSVLCLDVRWLRQKTGQPASPFRSFKTFAVVWSDTEKRIDIWLEADGCRVDKFVLDEKGTKSQNSALWTKRTKVHSSTAKMCVNSIHSRSAKPSL